MAEVLFVGLGNMGLPMARKLQHAGLLAAVADLDPARTETFAAGGIASGERGGALDGDIVVTMLPAGADVRRALLEPGGALERPRALVIDMSSSAPSDIRSLGCELAARGTALVDAPVSGGVPGAERGDLTAMVGGKPPDVERARPVLAAMCATIHHVGPLGAGDTLKALNNYLSGAALWASCEALVVGMRAGLDPQTMIDVWKTSTGRSHAVEVKLPRAVLPRSFDYGFALGLLAKDLRIAAGVAHELGIPAPMLDDVEARYDDAVTRLGAASDVTKIVTLIETAAALAAQER